MEDQDLKNMWKAYDDKLEKLLTVNMQMLQKLQMQKAQSKLKNLLASKYALIISGLLWLVLLVLGVVWLWGKFWPILSIAGIFVINVIVIVMYIKQAILIGNIKNTETVLDAQRKLAGLQVSQIRAIAVMMLQFPFYTTFYLKNSMFTHPNWALWALQISVMFILTYLSIWLYRNLNFKNINKKWWCAIMYGSGWATGQQAAKFLIEIEEFKTESYT